MTEILRLPFEERKKNAPNIEFIVERMLSMDSSSNSSSMSYSFAMSAKKKINFTPTNNCKLINNFKKIKKSNKKFVTTITTKIAPFDTFSLNDGNDVNNSTTEIINDRNKQIKGVLSSIIKLKKEKQFRVGEIEDKIDKINFGFNGHEDELRLKKPSKKFSTNLIKKNLLLFDEKQMSASKELRNKSNTEHSPDLSEDDNKKKPSTKNSSSMLFDYGGNSNNNIQTNFKNSIIRQIGLEPYYSRSDIHQTSHTSILDRLKRLKKKQKGEVVQNDIKSRRSSIELIDNDNGGSLPSSPRFEKKIPTHPRKKESDKNNSDAGLISKSHKNTLSLTLLDKPTILSTSGDKEKLFFENRNRMLIKENYTVYDSLSDDEDVNDLIDNAFTILPDSLFIKIWETLLNIILLYYTLFEPVIITFPKSIPIYGILLDLLFDCYFIADIVISFFIPYPIENSSLFDYEYSRSKIALHYLKSWFIFDVALGVPLNSIINLFFGDSAIINCGAFFMKNQYLYFSKLVKIVVVFKSLIKQKRHKKYERSFIDNYIGVSAKRLIQFFLFLFTLTHISSCVWVFIGKLEYPNWIIRQGLLDKNSTELYFASMYYNIATIFSIGYGDICTANEKEQLYNIILQALGLFLYSYIVSSMSYILKVAGEKNIELERKLAILEAIKMQYGVGFNLVWKIRKYLYYENEKNQQDKISFLQSLPNNLKNEMISTMYHDIINFKFFKNTNFEFKNKVIMNLKPIQAEMNNILIQMNTLVDDLILIKRGILSIEYQYNGYIIKISKLRRGEHFGEVNMLLHKRCPFDIVVKSKKADLYLLNKTSLIELGNEFPDLFDKLKKKSLINYSLFKSKLKKEIEEVKIKMRCVKTHTICSPTRTGKNPISEISGIGVEHFYHNQFYNNVNHYNCILVDAIEEESDEMSSKQSEGKSEDKSEDISESRLVLSPNKSSNQCRRSDNYHLSVTKITSKSIGSPVLSSLGPKRSMKSESLISNNKKKYPSPFFRRKSSINLSGYGKKDESVISAGHTKGLRHSTRSLNFTELRKSGIDPINSNVSRRKYSMKVGIREYNRMNSKSSKNLMGVRPSISKFQKHSIEINKNIRMGSMSINEPTAFYESVFDRWTIDDQIKRIKKIHTKLKQKKQK